MLHLPRFLHALAATLVVVGASSTSAAPATASPAPARVIVTYKSLSIVSALQGKSPTERLAARLDALARRQGLELRGQRAVSEHGQVVIATGIDTAALLRRLSADSDVAYAEPDYLVKRAAVPNDPLYATGGVNGPVVGQWYLKTPAGAVRASIDATAAWDRTTGSANVVVAVLDTGVRFDHPDLGRATQGGKLLPGYDFITNTTYTNDGDGRDGDASDPGDWVTQAEVDSGVFGPNCEASPSSWHGTQVSGIVGALSNNGIGMTGVGWGVRVLPLRVLGRCLGFSSDIIAAMRWATGIAVPGLPSNPTPARVLNLSLGGVNLVACLPNSAYQSAIDDVIARGAAVVVSAGNSDGHAVTLPANCSGVITVAGLRHIGTKVGFSDVGPEVAISAPGGNCGSSSTTCQFTILSASNAGVQGPGASIFTDGFNYAVGTSFSAPMVAGTAALMLSVHPNATPAQLRALLQSSARTFPTTGADPGTPQCAAPSNDSNGNPIDQGECYCTTTTCGAGMLDARAAVEAARTQALAATGVQALIGVSPANPVVGQTITLNASGSQFGGSNTLASANWTLVDGGGIATGLSAASGAQTTIASTSGSGTLSVQLTVTDNLGQSSTQSLAIYVAEAPAVSPAPSGGGGGGGALGAGYLLALLAAVLAARQLASRRS